MILRLLKRNKAPRPLPEAELARRLTDPDYACACCGVVLGAATEIVRPAAPFGWVNPPEPTDDETFELGYMEMLTQNYARRDGNFLLRALLPVPVKGTDAQVFFGVWCSLKSGSHARFRSAQARGEADRIGEMPSWLYTQIPPLSGRLLTEGFLTPFSDGRMPLYWITSEKHPFHAAQRDGLTATEILSLYEAFGEGELVAHLKA